ncbi:MAG: outer membrane lipoprotein carrier protein LolA [candidate division WOR-3 bacterium]|nr:MAG: outer membrane lipoprotein carrier protein LolA [candidate division WOR-3 bacterium]
MRQYISLTVLFLSQLFALEANEIIGKTIEKYRNMDTFYTEFEQEYCDEDAGICQRFEGKTYYMKPNFFRMEIEEPRQIYVGDSLSLWIYMPDEKRAIRQELHQMPFQISPDALFENYEEEFVPSLTSEGEDHYEIMLEPKDETDIYRRLKVTIKKETFEILVISVVDESGIESKFEFTKVEINKKIDRKIFDFNPPKGVKIDEY